MPRVEKYYLQPTKLIPNNPRPLLHYPGLLKGNDLTAIKAHDLFDSNNWASQWIWRYGPSQTSHYHSEVHECMVVLTGQATIRWGAGDLSEDLQKSTWEDAYEKGGIETHAEAGDVFIIPAGVSHKTHNTTPSASMKLLTPGNGHGIQTRDVRELLGGIELSGFTMLGAYPKNSRAWDFAVGTEDMAQRERTWTVPKPTHDPVLGESTSGLRGSWVADCDLPRAEQFAKTE